MMEWCKLQATFSTDPKVIGLSDRAFRRYVEGLCYATLHETDGFVPMAADKWRTELETAGLLDEGSVVHNWTKFNPSKAELSRRRQETRDRVRAYRERTNDVQPDYNGVSNADVPTSTSTSSSAVVLRTKESPDFVEFYEAAYPRREGRGAARAAWDKAIRKAEPDAIIAGARRFAADPNREDGFTPHPATWLNQERWSDDPLPPRSSGKARSVSNLLAMADAAERRELG